MSKKPANSKHSSSFTFIQVDPGISAIVDSALKSEAAVLEAKRGYREYARKRGIAEARRQRNEDIETIYANGVQMVNTRKRQHQPDHKEWVRKLEPSNHNKTSFNSMNTDWHKQARTGVTGKPAARVPKSDARYSAYPFVPADSTT